MSQSMRNSYVSNETSEKIFKTLLCFTVIIGLMMLSMESLAQDSGGESVFNFKPNDEIAGGLEEGSSGWWKTIASVALDGSLVYAVIAALWPSLRRTLWVPFVVFAVAYFGGGSSTLMKEHVDGENAMLPSYELRIESVV